MRGWWESVSGSVSQLFGYDLAVVRPVRLGSLGVVWLMPAAVIAAGISYVATKALDAYQTHQQLAAAADYVRRGYTPAQAAAAVAQANPSGGLFKDLTGTVKWVLIGGTTAALLYVFVIRPRLRS